MPKIKKTMCRIKLKTKLVIAFLFFLVSAALAGADVQFSIRFYDKKIYYPESDIELKVSLVNQSASPYKFRLADNRSFALGFEARNLANQPLRLSRKFIIDRNSNQPVFFRELSLDPGEEFSFQINLKDFIEIPESGIYTVQARFFPDLYNDPSAPSLSSNQLSLAVRPSVAGIEAVKETIDMETGEILKEFPLPPDQVVDYVIDARRKSQWNKFFLYLDLESLYQRSPQGARKYKNLSETGRIEAVKNFKKELSAEKIENEILTIPTEYEIIKTTYTQREAVVEVVQKFAYKGYKEVKQYTYYLFKKNDIWKVYNYDVRNIGTE